MLNESILSNLTIALELSPEIEDLVLPLKDHFGVTSLVYGKNYNDGSEIRLTNQPAWVNHYYTNSLYLTSGFEQHPSKLHTGYAVWSHLTHHQKVLKEAREFNIDHGMTLLQKTPDGCEFFFIGTTSDNYQVTNLLLNNLEFLHRFTFYFKEKASALFKKVNQHRIIIPQKIEKVFSEEQGLPFKKRSIDLETVFQIKKYQLDNDIKLSARELACAKLLVSGHSTKLIAGTLDLSPRTIETHINRLKTKLGCNSKAMLISKLNEFNISLI